MQNVVFKGYSLRSVKRLHEQIFHQRSSCKVAQVPAENTDRCLPSPPLTRTINLLWPPARAARRGRSRRIITGSVAEHFEVVVFDTYEQNSLPATLEMVVHKPVGDVRVVTQITCIQQLLNTRRWRLRFKTSHDMCFILICPVSKIPL